jgi:hypothetical protein
VHVWRLVNPNPFAVDGTFLVDGVAVTTLTVPASGSSYVGYSAPRQPGYVATFIPASATVIPSPASASSGARCAYHLDINLSWRGADVPLDTELAAFRLVVRSQVEELVFGWAGGGLFLISETALTGEQVFQARSGWLDVPTGGRWESELIGLPPGWAQAGDKSAQVFAPTASEVAAWAGPFFAGDDTMQLVLVSRFGVEEPEVTEPEAVEPEAPELAEPAPAAPVAVDQRNLPVTGPGAGLMAAGAASTLVGCGLLLRHWRRRADEVLVSRPL